MSLNVESPLGSSPLCEAVIKVLEQIEGLDAVRIGPPVYEPTKIVLECHQHHDDLKLTIPLKNGFRIFLISHFQGSDEAGQLCALMVRALRHTALPTEVAENDRGERPIQRLRNSKSPATASPTGRTWTRNVPATRSVRVKPAEIMVPELLAMDLDGPGPPVVDAPPTSAKILAEAGHWADPDGYVEGLISRLINAFGQNNAPLIKTLVFDLQNQGQLEFIGPTAVTEPYQKHRIRKAK